MRVCVCVCAHVHTHVCGVLLATSSRHADAYFNNNTTAESLKVLEETTVRQAYAGTF